MFEHFAGDLKTKKWLSFRKGFLPFPPDLAYKFFYGYRVDFTKLSMRAKYFSNETISSYVTIVQYESKQLGGAGGVC